jgi:hypothetical protein
MYNPVQKSPLYTTVQVAKFFFGYGKYWMYLHLNHSPKMSHPDIEFTLNPLRTNSKYPARRFRLYDVELFAQILAAHGVLNGIQLARTVRIVKLSAEMWGYRP